MKVQIRPRAEYRNGVLFPRPKDAESTGFINNRARFLWGMSGIVCLSVCPRNMLAYGGRILKSIRMVVFILNEAWAKLDFGSGFFAKLGRQSLVYDDERIMGCVGLERGRSLSRRFETGL